MALHDRFAAILAILGVAVTLWISGRVFENLPHLEDEMAYVWQAQAIAYGGTIKLDSPPCPTCFLVPFVIDYQGYRFGKYPIAWPVVLAAGVKLGVRNLVNPLLAGLGIWLTYLLGKKLLGARVGLLAAFLTLFSPFFLMNSSSLLSHPFGLVLSLVFALSWLDTFHAKDTRNEATAPLSVQDNKQFSMKQLFTRQAPAWMTALTAGLALGVLALTRPLTAIGVVLPFAIDGLVLLWHGSKRTRQLVLLSGGVGLITSLLLFAWQFAVTGNPLLDPYTLWWPYDKIGFGPGIGLAPQGNDLAYTLTNIYTSLKTGASDLFGWWMISWIFLPFGVWAVRHERRSWPVAAVFPSLVLVYTLYWIGAWLLGPRYYYEGLYSLTILSAAGIIWLAGLPQLIDRSGQQRMQIRAAFIKWHKPDLKAIWKIRRPLAVATLLAVLVCASVVLYDPARIGGLYGLYGVSRANIDNFLDSQPANSTPALVIVHLPGDSWIGYGTLLDLENPMLNTPYIFIVDHGSLLNQPVIEAFPNRKVINYYP